MLQAMHAGLDRLLPLVGHTWSTEVLLQQRQGTVMPLMTHILVAPIQSGNTMGLGDHKSSVPPLGIEHRYKAP